MKKARLVLAVFTIAALATLAAAQAAPESDPFGGSEEGSSTSANYGNANCGSGTTDVVAGEVKADQNKGVYVCNDGSNGSPLSTNPAAKVEGRIYVFKDANNGVHVVVDGDDRDNTGGAKGWDRLDVNSSGGAACFRRGSGGQAWNTNGTADTPDAPPNNGAPLCTPA